MGEARIVTINGGWPIQSRSVRLSGVAMQPAIPISRSPSRAHLSRKEHGEGGAPGYYHAKHLHFIACSCYRRRPLWSTH